MSVLYLGRMVPKG